MSRVGGLEDTEGQGGGVPLLPEGWEAFAGTLVVGHLSSHASAFSICSIMHEIASAIVVSEGSLESFHLRQGSNHLT